MMEYFRRIRERIEHFNDSVAELNERYEIYKENYYRKRRQQLTEAEQKIGKGDVENEAV